MAETTISIVTPTLYRPDEVMGMLDNLCKQEYLPTEVILVDGAPDDETQTRSLVKKINKNLPFNTVYIRKGGGTAIQRNIGIEAAIGNLICFIDDDIRLENDFLKIIVKYFQNSIYSDVGGFVGYRMNETINPKIIEDGFGTKDLGYIRALNQENMIIKLAIQ